MTLLSKEAALYLAHELQKGGELRFPVGAAVAGAISGRVYKNQRSKKSRPSRSFFKKLYNGLWARCSDGYTNVMAFILWIGVENVNVWSDFEVKKGKMGKMVLIVRLKPNKALKCAPSGPDAAALRRLT
jgi:hypothetical protein